MLLYQQKCSGMCRHFGANLGRLRGGKGFAAVKLRHCVINSPTSSLASSGMNTYQDGVNFLRDKFVRLNRNPGRKTVYTHVTCATDTNNIQFVFESVTDIIISEHLRDTGLL